MQQAEKQAAAVRVLQAGYVVVVYDYMLDEHGDYTGSDVPPASFLRQHFGNDFFSIVVRVEYPAGRLPECGLTPLDSVRGLRHLSLRATKVRDADFELSAVHGLQSLDAAFTDITDATVSSLATLSSLQSLDLSGTVITDASLEHLRACPNLRDLTLQDTLVSEQAIERLKAVNPSLKIVRSHSPLQTVLNATRDLAQLGAAVHFVEQTDATADVDFFSVPGYRIAVIGSDSIWNHWKGTEVDLDAIKHIEGLSNLYLADLPLTERLWQLLSELPALKSLTLSDMMTNGLNRLNEIGNGQLVHLSLANTRIADRDAASIASLPLLESLSLQDTGITDKALTALEQLKHLRQIDVSRTQITDAGVASIRKLENLEKVVFDNTRISDAGLARLKDHRTLRRLGLMMTQITDAGLAELAKQENIEEKSAHQTLIVLLRATGCNFKSCAVARNRGHLADVQDRVDSTVQLTKCTLLDARASRPLPPARILTDCPNVANCGHRRGSFTVPAWFGQESSRHFDSPSRASRRHVFRSNPSTVGSSGSDSPPFARSRFLPCRWL